ncbi:hypothetical protein NPS01_12790 [Nocardioides psychrotolerans]|uniref:Uncharacterized protein n=1 Tax=Nocardioides psychrotolerans TaxID=1005945 RepID=A0A1I3HFW7_9ACTN|nr:hypothetical protein [Nocardioides psychrotolerans]GEP37616.1 hypothetical protein NPS01_12790 [Nocardioides psychrotolerans]SFI34553.1 hypothetical protein SAMN05216561_107165 [Nocardioides psychrotolerans]
MSELPATDDDLTGEPFEKPPGEHSSELPSDNDATDPSGKQAENAQEENAQTSGDQPSQ